MAEQADARDSKSRSSGSEGSTPSRATMDEDWAIGWHRRGIRSAERRIDEAIKEIRSRQEAIAWLEEKKNKASWRNWQTR